MSCDWRDGIELIAFRTEGPSVITLDWILGMLRVLTLHNSILLNSQLCWMDRYGHVKWRYWIVLVRALVCRFGGIGPVVLRQCTAMHETRLRGQMLSCRYVADRSSIAVLLSWYLPCIVFEYQIKYPFQKLDIVNAPVRVEMWRLVHVDISYFSVISPRANDRITCWNILQEPHGIWTIYPRIPWVKQSRHWSAPWLTSAH